MPQNLELKSCIPSIQTACRRARKLHAKYKGMLIQRDQYYDIPQGRLKLRTENARRSELIYYLRPNRRANRYSNYSILPVTEAKLIDKICTAAYGKKIEVAKKRHLFLYKNARIHIDEVKRLGTYIEFEVIVKKGRLQAQKLLNDLSVWFGIKGSEKIAGSYSDLLLSRKNHS